MTDSNGIGEFELIARYFAPIAGPGSAGEAPSPRDAARALEAAFPTFVRSAPRFAMQAEREVSLRAALQLPHTVELDHALAVARGEHVRPVSVTDAAGWDRWLKEERRLGSRQWISPKDMREWFGDAWQDPRAKREETANRPARALIAPRGPTAPAS